MILNKKYSAKILLFGEYSIINGSEALAIPYPRLSGKWEYWKHPESIHLKQRDLGKFRLYLEQHFEGFNSQKMKDELDKGLYFLSQIPQGYGAGSSGALCAAIYDVFFINKKNNISELKSIFSLMESFFHGKSSGLDPLICYLNQGIHIKNKEMYRINYSTNDKEIFLLNTKKSRSTAPLVNIYLEKLKDASYEHECKEKLVPLVSNTIDAFLNHQENIFEQVHHISQFQHQYFREMIPKEFENIWKKGLDGNEYKIKLCGAGGGGFLLVFFNPKNANKEEFKNIELLEI